MVVLIDVYDVYKYIYIFTAHLLYYIYILLRCSYSVDFTYVDLIDFYLFFFFFLI